MHLSTKLLVVYLLEQHDDRARRRPTGVAHSFERGIFPVSLKVL